MKENTRFTSSVGKRMAAMVLGILMALAMITFIPDTDSYGIGAVNVEAATKTQISAKSLTLNQGTAKTLSVKKGKKAVKGVKWSTGNKNVATVNKNGKVTAVAYGSTNITAKYGKSTYKCSVTVRGLNKGSLTLTAGKSANLQLGKLTKAQNKGTIKWSSSNSKVVQVKKISKTKYRVTAKKAGTAKVTARVGKTNYTCTVKVKAAPKANTNSKAKTNNTGSTSSKQTSSANSKSSTVSSSSTASKQEHVHNWVAQTKQVQDGTKTVVDKEAYDEQVLVHDAYDRETIEYHFECHGCGQYMDDWTNEQISEHVGREILAYETEILKIPTDVSYANLGWTLFHPDTGEGVGGNGDRPYKKTIHVDAEYKTVHHDAVTHEEPVYKTVTTYKCSTCGAEKAS